MHGSGFRAQDWASCVRVAPREEREPSNKGMKLSERGSLGGSCPRQVGVMESRSAAYAQCWPTSQEARGSAHAYRAPRYPSVAEVVVPLTTIEAAGQETTVLEIAVLTCRGTDHSVQASPRALCRHGRSDGPFGPVFRRGIPFLRLLEISKGGESVEVVVGSHDALPAASPTPIGWAERTKSVPDLARFVEPWGCGVVVQQGHEADRPRWW